CAGMASAAGVAAHVWSTTETGQSPFGYGRGIAFHVHLQRGADEQVNRILAGELREDAVRPQTAVVTGEEHVGACAGVVRHAHFTPEADDAIHPTALDRRD